MGCSFVVMNLTSGGGLRRQPRTPELDCILVLSFFLKLSILKMAPLVPLAFRRDTGWPASWQV